MSWIPDWISFSAIAQIAILYFVVYAILKAAKGSKFGQALMGVGIIAATMFAFTFLFHFDVLSKIVRALLVYIAISSVVIFQPEIRRILAMVGAFGYLERPKYTPDGAATPQLITESIMSLAERKIGALIAFERGISLRGYEETGVAVNATFSRELVESIFTPPLPLHDGGAVLRKSNVDNLRRNGRIYFIDRPLDMIGVTDDRPLSSTREQLEKRYKERYPIYLASADCVIKAVDGMELNAQAIMEEMKNENSRA